MKRAWDDICFTPKWACSHAVDSFHHRSLVVTDLEQAGHVRCQSYRPSLARLGPSEVLPGPGNVPGPRPGGRMLVREFGSNSVKTVRQNKSAGRGRKRRRKRRRRERDTEYWNAAEEDGRGDRNTGEKTLVVRASAERLSLIKMKWLELILCLLPSHKSCL